MVINPKPRELPSKIALFGLGNAGKTSIVKTLLSEFDAFTSILPTTGVDRTSIDFFGRELLIWDFGGQVTYRNSYLANPMMYFQGIRYLYYVVDAQDSDRIDESIEYFVQIFQNCLDFSQNFQVFLFFHKIDPNYEGPVFFPEVEDRFLSQMLPQIQNSHITPTVFHTSIFKPMSVISAFSQPLLGNATIYETLCDAIESFCWENNLVFGMLFVENYEIGSYFESSKLNEFIDKHIAKYLDSLDDMEEIPSYQIGRYEIHTEQFSLDVGDQKFVFNLALGYNPLEIEDELGEIEESIADFAEALQKILQNAEIIRTGQLRIDEIYDKEKIIEIRRRQEEMEELSELDEEDKQKYIQKERELEILEDQRVNFELEHLEWTGSIPVEDEVEKLKDESDEKFVSENFEEKDLKEEDFIEEEVDKEEYDEGYDDNADE
ncbi:MAG: ADP-ribosylation factor-like protein [Promethearchaeota archaeon]